VLVFVTEHIGKLLGKLLSVSWQLRPWVTQVWLMVSSVVLMNTDSFISQGILSIFVHMNPLYIFAFDERRPSAWGKVISKPILHVALCIGRWKVNKQVELR